MRVKAPKNLYKYLTFNENTIESLISHKAYYADPAQFNDPLDCKPVISVDVTLQVLEDVACHLIRMRSQKELSLMAKRLKFRDMASEGKISKISESDVKAFLQEVDYFSTENDECSGEVYKALRFTKVIDEEVTSVFKRGVWCLSSKFNSPLMWSHYANNHKGFCIEYDMSDVDEGSIKKVIYGGSRKLKVSTISEWINSGIMPKEMEDVCLLTKSSEWSYESEWRLFSTIGLGDIEPAIKSVIFGMNCKDSTIATVINCFSNYRRKIKFWKISNQGVGFKLSRNQIDIDELKYHYDNILTYGEIKRIFDEVDFPQMEMDK